MKKFVAQRLGRLILPMVLSLGFFSARVSQGQTNAYWDVNGVTNGQGGTGTWSQSGTNWTTNSVNADSNSGGPTGGGLFAVTNSATASITNSAGYIFNFQGSAGVVNLGGNYSNWGVNFLTPGYVLQVSSSGANTRNLYTTNGVNLGANSLTISGGTTGTNTIIFQGNSTATAVGIVADPGASLIFSNSNTNPFGIFFTGGAVSANAPITINIAAGTRLLLGSQSSGGVTINANTTCDLYA